MRKKSGWAESQAPTEQAHLPKASHVRQEGGKKDRAESKQGWLVLQPQPSATRHFFSRGNCTEAAHFQARLKNALSKVSRMNKHTGWGQGGEHLITECSDAACLLLAPHSARMVAAVPTRCHLGPTVAAVTWLVPLSLHRDLQVIASGLRAAALVSTGYWHRFVCPLIKI